MKGSSRLASPSDGSRKGCISGREQNSKGLTKGNLKAFEGKGESLKDFKQRGNNIFAF